MYVLVLLVPSAANTYYYQFSKNKKTWQDAQDYCSTQYDNLVEFYEQGMVETALVDKAVSMDYRGEAWIGLKTKILDWTWVNGEPVQIDKWDENGGSGDGHCALMTDSGFWRAAHCSLNENVMCEESE